MQSKVSHKNPISVCYYAIFNSNYVDPLTIYYVDNSKIKKKKNDSVICQNWTGRIYQTVQT